MRTRTIPALALGVSVVLATAATLAQRQSSPPRLAFQTTETKKVDAPSWRGKFTQEETKVADRAPADSIVDVDAFLDRSRKEADDAVNVLGREAEALRARLRKVESALARWQAVSAALKHQNGPEANEAGPLLQSLPPSADPASSPPPLPQPEPPAPTRSAAQPLPKAS